MHTCVCVCVCVIAMKRPYLLIIMEIQTQDENYISPVSNLVPQSISEVNKRLNTRERNIVGRENKESERLKKKRKREIKREKERRREWGVEREREGEGGEERKGLNRNCT